MNYVYAIVLGLLVAAFSLGRLSTSKRHLESDARYQYCMLGAVATMDQLEKEGFTPGPFSDGDRIAENISLFCQRVEAN